MNRQKYIIDRIKEAKEKKSKELNCCFYGVTKIPEELFELEYLESLDLTGNPIQEIPQQIFRLPNLKSLNLAKNKSLKIYELPSDISKLTFF